jgi:PAS domain S-box-containing protein
MEKTKIRLLLVEDDPVDQMAFKRLVSIEKLPYEFQVAGSVLEAGNLIASHVFDVVIADYLLGDGTLFDLMDRFADVPVIVTTGAGNEETAVRAMKAGACDYLIKDTQGNYLHTLPLVVNAAIRRKEIEQELERYRDRLEEQIKTRTAQLESEITVRKRVADTLQTKEQHLRSILESATGFAVYRLARVGDEPPNLITEFISPSIKQILGINPETFTPNYFLENVHPDDLERVMAANARTLKTNRFDEVCRFYNPAKKRWAWIQAISNVVRNNAGQITHINGIFLDVTEKHRAFHKLEKSEKELVDKSKNLMEMNAALNALIKNMELKESNIQKQIAANLQHLVFPYLNKIDAGTMDITRKSLVAIVQSNLNKITSNFSGMLSSSLCSLTSTEIKVANLVRLGNTTKEIAATLKISHKTVESHRERIRKKLGINNKKINLRSHLLSLN